MSRRLANSVIHNYGNLSAKNLDCFPNYGTQHKPANLRAANQVSSIHYKCKPTNQAKSNQLLPLCSDKLCKLSNKPAQAFASLHNVNSVGTVALNFRAAKPKPIYVSGKFPDEANSNPVCTLSDSKIKTTKNGTRINCKSLESYSRLIRYLASDPEHIKFHTFQMKQTKTFRAVIRNLNKNTPTTWIHEQVTKLGYQVVSVNVIKNRHTKALLPLFQVEIVCNDKEPSTQLLQLTQLGNKQVTIEPQLCQNVVQCHRCQKFGHSKNYCQRPFVCVKCAGNHPSVICSKPFTLPAKCANCKGQHTANFLGCKAYKNATKIIKLQDLPYGQKVPAPQQKSRNQAVTVNPTKNQSKCSVLRCLPLPANLSFNTKQFIKTLSYAEVIAQQPQKPPPRQTKSPLRQSSQQCMQLKLQQHQQPRLQSPSPKTKYFDQKLPITPPTRPQRPLSNNIPPSPCLQARTNETHTLERNKANNFCNYAETNQITDNHNWSYRKFQKQTTNAIMILSENINKIINLVTNLITPVTDTTKVNNIQNVFTTK